MILFDSMAHLRKLKQLFLERIELPEDVWKRLEDPDEDMIIDPIERLPSDDSLTEKTIELDDGYQGLPLLDNEEEKRLEEMKKRD